MNTIAFTPQSPTVKMVSPERNADASLWNWRTADCTVQVVENPDLIDPATWQNTFAGHCRDYRYYELIGETLCGQFEQKFFLIRNEITGNVAVQPFFFVDQDLLAGLPRHLRNALSALRKIWPRFLDLKMMMIGCAAGEGQLDCEDPAILAALHDAVIHYAKREKAAMILLKDFPAKYRKPLNVFSSNGYTRVPSMPGARLEIDFSDFEEYMQRRLGRIFRKNLRRKFRNGIQFGPLTMEVMSDITPFVDDVYPLYLQTYNRSDFKFERLTKEYLCDIGRRIPERTRYFVWRQQGRIIAFALCMVHEGTIHDLNVGMDYSVALDMHLYFLTFRDIIQWAAENGLRCYSTGALNYDPKLHLRLDLDPLDLYARHTSELINRFFKIALRYLQPARHDLSIRRFRNVHELY